MEDLGQTLGNVIEILVDEGEHSAPQQQSNYSLCCLQKRDRTEANRCLSRGALV